MEDAFGHQQRWARRCFQTLLYQWQWPDLGFLRHPGEEPKTPTSFFLYFRGQMGQAAYYFFLCYQIWYQQGNYLGRRSDSCRRRWTQEIQTYSFIPSQESKSTLLAGLKALLSYNSLILISFYGFNNRQRGLMNKKTSTAPNPDGL